MTQKCENWNKLKLSVQYRKKFKKCRSKINKGFDTETNPDGNIYLIADNSGRYAYNSNGIPLSELIDFLTYKDNRYTLNTFFNLRFDTNAILKQLPIENLKELWRFNITSYENYTIKLIPKKFLSIRKEKSSYNFYDISQFYNTSLDYASKKFLGKSKLIANLKNPVKDKIIDYCINDAILCKELTDYLLKQYHKIGLNLNKLYSTAYVSQKYFHKYCDIPILNRKHKWAEYAFNSYHGGKFETLQRGTFDKLYYYDINSAYPYEIAQLWDLRRGYWEHKKEYDKDCKYAFIQCKIKIDMEPSIIPYPDRNLNIYPKGDLGVNYITKNEYEYLETHKYEIEFIDGYFWKPIMEDRPFTILKKLYEFRQKLKSENNPLEHNIKILLNSLYGKFIQITVSNEKSMDFEDFDSVVDDKDDIELIKKIYKTGNLFNPVYASLITANTRLKLVGHHNKNIVGYATDSILSTRSLDLHIDTGLGNWKLEGSGTGTVIGSGIYVLDFDKRIERFRGFGNTIKYDLKNNLNANLKNTEINFEVERPINMGEALAHIHTYTLNDICKFKTTTKKLNINFDSKRNWERNFQDCDDLLHNNISSEMRDIDAENKERHLNTWNKYTVRHHIKHDIPEDYYTDKSLTRHEQKILKDDAWKQFIR